MYILGVGHVQRSRTEAAPDLETFPDSVIIINRLTLNDHGVIGILSVQGHLGVDRFDRGARVSRSADQDHCDSLHQQH